MKIVVEGNEITISEKTKVKEIAKRMDTPSLPMTVAVKVNHEMKELNYVLEEPAKIEMIRLNHPDGIRIYQRSLSFVFLKAVHELYPGMQVYVKHSLSKGLYCEFSGNSKITAKDIPPIKEKMQEIIDADYPIEKSTVSLEEAKAIFSSLKMDAKVNLLSYRNEKTFNIYNMDGYANYFYGYMVPSTGYLKWFDLMHYSPGIILQHPSTESFDDIPDFEEQKQVYEIHNEAEQWGDILGVSYIANLNQKIEEGKAGELIRIVEALHEKKIAAIADRISLQKKRVILIAGPSSSGKTTFANRLKVQLMVNGLNPVTLSVDDYFVNRDRTPRDEKGEYDFESIYAVDLEQFNEDLKALLDGEKVQLPTFNFMTGEREYKGNYLQVTDDQPIIIEGIHGLNDLLTAEILQKDKFKIYISALTQLNIDDHNRVPTTDTRIIRRIVRDNNYRGHSARKTISMWQSVRRGEEKNIFPFQERADAMFNSALVYELAVLKKHVVPLLEDIKPEEKEYTEAKRLLKFIKYFVSIEDDELIPSTSIIKEFIGGSCFRE